jgi:hypothetical protein
MGVWAMRVPMWLRCFGVALVLPVLSWQTPRPAHGTFELVANVGWNVFPFRIEYKLANQWRDKGIVLGEMRCRSLHS